MRKIILTIVTVLFSVSMKSQQISLEKNRIDYGIIQLGSDGSKEVNFTNIGTVPLIIKNVIGQCGCTSTMENNSPGWTTTPILPNEKGVIKFKYDTKRLGKFNKIITIQSNDILGDKVICIYGEVIEKND